MFCFPQNLNLKIRRKKTYQLLELRFLLLGSVRVHKKVLDFFFNICGFFMSFQIFEAPELRYTLVDSLFRM